MIKKIVLHSFIILIAFLLIGKLDFSLLHNGSVLIYETHDTLFHKPLKNQEGYIWTRGMSRRSDKIVINNIGTRGEGQTLSCDKIRILSTGSSSGFGEGVSEESVWSARLNKLFTDRSVNAEIYNGGVPGWGFYQWSNYISLYAEEFSPEIVFIPLSHGDFWFYPPAGTVQERASWVESDKKKKAILNYDNVIGYILRKTQYILTAMKKKYFSSKSDGESQLLGDQLNGFKKHFKNQLKYIDTLIDLSKQHDFKLVFFVRNADFTVAGQELYKELSTLSSQSDGFFVGQVSPKDFPINIKKDDVEKYYNEMLIIKHDGHPNDFYSQLMADKAYEVLSHVIKDSGITAQPCK
ncbi:MAG: hypothetical protein ACRBCS_08545 [Cellvibrionaceae bacterium]